MTIQWTIIATFLYSEIAFIILLLVPFISPTVWQRMFKSRVCLYIADKANLYFSILIAILVIFFFDSLREMRKYSSGGMYEHDHGHLDAEIQISMKLFRSQRNYYIAGFALFLWLVIRRLIILISSQATLLAESEGAMKQAQSATEQAERLMKEKEMKEIADREAAENIGNIQREEHERELCNLRGKLTVTEEELNHAKKDLLTMKSQAEAVTREYDKLLGEHKSLQDDLDKITGTASNKKEE